MAKNQGNGLMSPAPQPRINAAQRRVNNQMAQSGQQPRVNAAERRLINQGAMPAPEGYQGRQPQQAPQQQQPQRPPMPPQTGGGAKMQPQGQPQPMQRPNFQNPKQFAPGQFPGFGQGGFQGFQQWGQPNQFQNIDPGFNYQGGYGMGQYFGNQGGYGMGAGFPGGAPMQQGGFNWKGKIYG